MKANRIGRLMQILTILQTGRSYGAEELAELFDTCKRTIFRDLRELQSIGIPCRYDRKKSSYTMDPNFFLPPMDLSPQEVLGLLMLVHKAGGHLQMPYKNHTLLAALKVESTLPRKIRKVCNAALKGISFQVGAQAPMGKLGEMFHLLQDAMINRRKVQITYNSFFEKKSISLELWPYHLRYSHRAWYVIGFSKLHKQVRTFKLNRITEPKVLNRCFVEDKKFDLQDYFGSAWSMIPEGRIYNIKLRFLPKVAGNITEVLWHKTQKVTPNKGGSATVEFRVDGLGEITWWVLGYGDQVEVILPKKLRDRVRNVAQNTAKLNKKL